MFSRRRAQQVDNNAIKKETVEAKIEIEIVAFKKTEAEAEIEELKDE